MRPKHGAVFIFFPRTECTIGQSVTLTLLEPCGNLYFLLGLKCIPRYFSFVVHSKFFLLLSFLSTRLSLLPGSACCTLPALLGPQVANRISSVTLLATSLV